MGLKELFKDRCYCIGFRLSNNVWSLDKIKNGNPLCYIMPNWKYWYADPIPFAYRKEKYIFVEAYDRLHNKGMIGVSKINSKRKASKPVIVIDEPFHLSFPYIYQYKNDYYLIPESHIMKEFRIYKMGSNIYEWTLYGKVKTKKEYSDTVALIDENTDKLFFLCTEKSGKNVCLSKLHLFEVVDMEKGLFINEIDINDKPFSYADRNGGLVIEKNNEKYRVIQEAEEGWYGKDVVIRKIYNCNIEGFIESENLIRLEADDFNIHMGKKGKVIGMHTYGYCSGLEVIDFEIETFGSIKGLRMIWGKVKHREKCSLNV